MTDILNINPDTNYAFSFNEIAFLSGRTKGAVKLALHLPYSPQNQSYKIHEINTAFVEMFGEKELDFFTIMVSQANIRLWQHLSGIKVMRHLGARGYIYPKIKNGACELMRSHCTGEQKELVCQLMERAKFDTKWSIKERDQWMKGIRISLGMLAL